jgi:hypothetical protein
LTDERVLAWPFLVWFDFGILNKVDNQFVYEYDCEYDENEEDTEGCSLWNIIIEREKNINE